MNKCLGCKNILQDSNPNKEGYTKNINSKLCERCFKIKHYNLKDNKNVLNNQDIINKINKYHKYTLFLCDFLSLNNEVINLYNKITNNKILVITKCDLIPKNMNIKDLTNKIKISYNIKNIIFISTINNYGINEINNIINNNQDILICGISSSGKSTLINYLFNENLTVSKYQNTTLDFTSIKYNDLNIIDSPGFNIDNFNYDDNKIVIKTIKLKKGYELIIDDVSIYLDNDDNITLYINKNISYKTRKIRNEYHNMIDIKSYHDLIIKNIGFIYFKNSNKAYINDNSKCSIRRSIIK